MGEAQVDKKTDPEHLRRFMQQVLRDARALEKMLADGCFEEGVTRIGAEQELFLVDAAHRPAPRRPTKPTKGSKKRRLNAKTRRGTIKKLRSGKPTDD